MRSLTVRSLSLTSSSHVRAWTALGRRTIVARPQHARRTRLPDVETGKVDIMIDLCVLVSLLLTLRKCNGVLKGKDAKRNFPSNGIHPRAPPDQNLRVLLLFFVASSACILVEQRPPSDAETQKSKHDRPLTQRMSWRNQPARHGAPTMVWDWGHERRNWMRVVHMPLNGP